MNNNMNFDPLTGQPLNNNNTLNNGNINQNQNIAMPNQYAQTQNTNVQAQVQNTNIQPQQPIMNQNIELQNLNQAQYNPVPPVPTVEDNNINNLENIQNSLNSIPTVDQSRTEFMNNTQTMNETKKEEKKSGINYGFVIALFIIVLVAIIFLFPLLMKYI